MAQVLTRDIACFATIIVSADVIDWPATIALWWRK
jgi:hypothetical protein